MDLLVGHSLGGVVSVALAGRRPPVARALVLEDPPGSAGGDRAALAAGIAPSGTRPGRPSGPSCPRTASCSSTAATASTATWLAAVTGFAGATLAR